MRKLFLACCLCAAAASAGAQEAVYSQNFDKLKDMDGFSQQQISSHTAVYEGLVRQLADVRAELASFNTAKSTDTVLYRELERRLPELFNAVRLHEYYFQALGGVVPLEADSFLYKKIEKEFGSFSAWKYDFTRLALIEGDGWVILTEDPETGAFYNVRVYGDTQGVLAGGKILLVFDVNTHAYPTAQSRADYVAAYFKNIHWGKVKLRY